MKDVRISLNAAVAVTGVVLIAVYIIFGGSLTTKEMSRKKARKKGSIPGLANVGNTCFLNCILQALASCPSFVKWLESVTLNTSPVLLDTLGKIVKVLNNKTEDNVASAYDVLNALRSHGWVISTEEQDAHELFHALTSTIDDEIMLVRQQSNSLLNVSWIISENDETESPMFVNGCEEDGQNFMQFKEPNMGTSFHKPDLNSSDEPNKNSDYAPESSFKALQVKLSASRIKKDTSVISKVPSSLRHHSHSVKNSIPFESPFKGHLASQLQCSVCGFKNTEQWSTFESISLSLPPSSWTFQKCSLQELLDAFVRPEYVADVMCDGCSKTSGSPSRTTFSKKLTIGKLPECLCIHIQRTVWLENGCALKRKDFVAIPEVLNMDPYTYTVSINYQQTLRGGLLGGRDSLKTLSNVSVQSGNDSIGLFESLLSSQFQGLSSKRPGWNDHSLYKLQAVVVHVGDVFSGHFVTYRRGAINTNLKDRWFYTSDVLVKEVSLEEVLQSNAYMIIYERLSL